MSGASDVCEIDGIAAAKSPAAKTADGPGTDSIETIAPRRYRRGCPPVATIVHRHIHQHNVHLRITGYPPPHLPVIVHLPPFHSSHIDAIPGMGVPAAETETEDGATSEVIRPENRRLVCSTLTRYQHVHEHNVIMNVLEAPPNCPPILVHLPNSPEPSDGDEDTEWVGEEGAAFVEDPSYMSGPLDTRKMEITPSDIVMVDMRTSLNYPGGIYIGGNYVLGRDDNTMRIVKRNLSSFDAFYRLKYKRGRCRCYPADEVVRRAKSWEGRVYTGENRWAFAILCLTGLTIDEIHEREFKLTA